ncbi:MAG: hypothetical protein JW844_02515 [Candidatus Omnitrophica bacterium]|nr:hypothetical protein [Candidatus Omnitrophota bacterium]
MQGILSINQRLNLVLWLAVIVVIFSFFLPWIQMSVELGNTERFQAAKELFRKEPLFPKGRFILSGYDIPLMADSPDARVLTDLFSFFIGDSDYITLKSCLVYLVPIVAIVCGLLGLLSIQGRVYSAALIMLSGTVAAGGYYKLYYRDAAHMLLYCELKVGIPIILCSFGVIAVIGIFKLLIGKRI